MNERGEFSMGSNSCGHHMAWSVYNELRLEGKLCDVLIRVDDVEFQAHKNILCGCSSYFRALFASGWATSKRVYNIPSVSPNIMLLIIEFAYTHSVPVTEENVEELLAAADQFSIMGIVQACCDFLQDQLCLENCIGIWKFTDLHYCPDLRRKAYLFILCHFEEIVAVSVEFLELTVRELSDIIGEDKLNVRQESAVFEAILRWISHSPKERKGHVSKLLPKVRLALMTADYLIHAVKNNPLVKDNNECKHVLRCALRAMCDINMNRPSCSDDCKSLSRPRLPSAILLITGGWIGEAPTNGIEVYDIRADRWVSVDSNESHRGFHGVAFLNGFVYYVGGLDDVDYLSSVRKFNLVARTWHDAAPMHSRRCYVSVAVLNGRIYAMGGCDGHVVLNTAERYEPETNQWTQIARMHEHRSNSSATALHGKVYICGGFDGAECLSTAECYNPETNQWTLIAPMSFRRTGLGVAAYAQRIYAMGGFDERNRLRSVESYDPLTNSWRSVPSMLNARCSFGTAVWEDQLFVVGGDNGFTFIPSVERFDKKTNMWYDARDMEIIRNGFGCCVVYGLPIMAEYAAPRPAGASGRAI